jgi:hypothetical protein
LAGPQRRPAGADATLEGAGRGEEPAAAMEPPVLLLAGVGENASAGAPADAAVADPLASPTLAGLYASQGDPAMAETILRQINPNVPAPSEETPRESEPDSVAYLGELTRLREVAERLRKTRAR